MIAENQTVRILEDARVAPYWKGKTGRLVRWYRMNFYIVEIEGRELVFFDTDFEVIG
jgi:hypothetical protein